MSTTSVATRTPTATQSRKPPTQPENASTECDAKREQQGLTSPAEFPLCDAYYGAMEAALEALEQIRGDVSAGEQG